jgi:N-acetylglutamate synthase-like GNAT family acetyltransferase
MIEEEWTLKKGTKRLYLYTASLILIAVSIFLIIPQGEYLIGIATTGLPLIYLYTDIKVLLTRKKVRPIIPFQLHHQEGIDRLMLEIGNEFEEKMYSPDSKTISELSYDKKQKFWIALVEEIVIGTVGIALLENKNAALKRLMVAKEFRGSKNISKSLLEIGIAWAKKKGVTTIYLGTMSQMKAAHHFYEKNGFTRIAKEGLPKGFPTNPVDSVFYKLEI